MSGAVVDIHYSVERYFNTTFGSTYDIAYEGAPFRQEDSASWLYLAIFGPTGEPSRAADYFATGRISVRIQSRTSQRHCRIIAQVVEATLRGGTIPIYDETNKTTILGYMRLMDPSYQPLAKAGGLHAGVLDTEYVLHMTP